MAVEVEEVEGRNRRPLGLAQPHRLVSPSMWVTPRSSGTAISLSASGQLVERRAKQRGAVVAIAADELQLAAGNDREQPRPSCLTSCSQPAVRRRRAGRHDLQAQRARDFGPRRRWRKHEAPHGGVVRWRGGARLPSYPPGLRGAAMNGASRIEVLVVSVALVVVPLLAAVVYLVLWCRIRRRRRRSGSFVSFVGA